MHYLIATTFEVVHYIALQAVHYKPLQEVHLSRYNHGDARVDSDWDILILIDGERATCEDFEKFAYPFVDYGWSVGEQINPLIYSFEDWSKRSITPFYKNVQLEGVSLCR